MEYFVPNYIILLFIIFNNKELVKVRIEELFKSGSLFLLLYDYL